MSELRALKPCIFIRGHYFLCLSLGKPQKKLIAVPLRRGGGKGRAIKKKEKNKKNDGEVPTAIKLEVVKSLMALPLKRELFCCLPYNYTALYHSVER